MERPYLVLGMNPATGRVVSLKLLAASPNEAKQQAEEAGLVRVTVQFAASANGPEQRAP